jgi:hypothetical protein
VPRMRKAQSRSKKKRAKFHCLYDISTTMKTIFEGDPKKSCSLFTMWT